MHLETPCVAPSRVSLHALGLDAFEAAKERHSDSAPDNQQCTTRTHKSYRPAKRRHAVN